MEEAASGWSREGKKKYDEIYHAVKRDWKRQSPTFKQELLKMYQSQRKMETGRAGNGQMKDQSENRKRQVYRCINELNDTDDDSDNDEEQNNDDTIQATVVYKNRTAVLNSSYSINMNGVPIKTESV